jgi:hypothetical protein
MKVEVVIPSHASSSYGGKRVYSGDIIDIDPTHYSEIWMRKIKSKPGPKPARPQLSLSRKENGSS